MLPFPSLSYPSYICCQIAQSFLDMVVKMEINSVIIHQCLVVCRDKIFIGNTNDALPFILWRSCFVNVIVVSTHAANMIYRLEIAANMIYRIEIEVQVMGTAPRNSLVFSLWLPESPLMADIEATLSWLQIDSQTGNGFNGRLYVDSSSKLLHPPIFTLSGPHGCLQEASRIYSGCWISIPTWYVG